MVYGIHRRVSPFPIRPALNGWLYACFEEMEAREIPKLCGRSKGSEMECSLSQEWRQLTTEHFDDICAIILGQRLSRGAHVQLALMGTLPRLAACVRTPSANQRIREAMEITWILCSIFRNTGYLQIKKNSLYPQSSLKVSNKHPVDWSAKSYKLIVFPTLNGVK